MALWMVVLSKSSDIWALSKDEGSNTATVDLDCWKVVQFSIRLQLCKLQFLLTRCCLKWKITFPNKYDKLNSWSLIRLSHRIFMSRDSLTQNETQRGFPAQLIMPGYCAIPGCKSDQRIEEGLSFYSFPKEPNAKRKNLKISFQLKSRPQYTRKRSKSGHKLSVGLEDA